MPISCRVLYQASLVVFWVFAWWFCELCSVVQNRVGFRHVFVCCTMVCTWLIVCIVVGMRAQLLVCNASSVRFEDAGVPVHVNTLVCFWAYVYSCVWFGVRPGMPTNVGIAREGCSVCIAFRSHAQCGVSEGDAW